MPLTSCDSFSIIFFLISVVLVGEGLGATFKWSCFTDISFSCICPIVDREFHHNVVSYFDNGMMKFIINDRTDRKN